MKIAAYLEKKYRTVAEDEGLRKKSHDETTERTVPERASPLFGDASLGENRLILLPNMSTKTFLCSVLVINRNLFCF